MAMIPFSFKPNDVVCCRGGFRLHPGNLFYNSLLKKFVLRLAQANRLTKQDNDEVVDTILDTIINRRQGRFVRPTDDFKLAVVLTRTELEYKIRCDLRMKRLRFSARAASKFVAASRSSMIAKESVANKDRRPSLSTPSKQTPKKSPVPGAKDPVNSIRSSYVNAQDFEDDRDSLCSLQTTTLCRRQANLNSQRDLTSPSPVKSSCSTLTHGKKTMPDHDTGRSDTINQSMILYGSASDEIHMRRWLNNHHLPQSVGDAVLELGARNVDDIILLVKSQPKMLQHLPVLDMVKLRRAVQC